MLRSPDSTPKLDGLFEKKFTPLVVTQCLGCFSYQISFWRHDKDSKKAPQLVFQSDWFKNPKREPDAQQEFVNTIAQTLTNQTTLSHGLCPSCARQNPPGETKVEKQ